MGDPEGPLPLVRVTSISWRYPAVEALTAALFAAVAAATGPGALLPLQLLFVAALVLVSDIDIAERIIPDVVILPVGLIGVVGMTILAPGGGPRWEWLASGLAAAGLLLTIGLLYEWLRGVQGMGMGDVKLALCMGFFLGTAVIPALFIGFIAGALPASCCSPGAETQRPLCPSGPSSRSGPSWRCCAATSSSRSTCTWRCASSRPSSAATRGGLRPVRRGTPAAQPQRAANHRHPLRRAT